MGTVTVIIFSMTRNYKVFVICCFFFGLVIMVCMFLWVPESPRYYIATNQSKKALGVYKFLSKLHPDKNVKERIATLEDRVNMGLVL
jgi:hypothetical protein